MNQFQSSIKFTEIKSCPKCTHKAFTNSDKFKIAFVGKVKCIKCNTSWGYHKFDSIKAIIPSMVLYFLVLIYFEEYFNSRLFQFELVLLFSVFNIVFSLFLEPKELPTEPEVDWSDFFENLRKGNN